MIGHPPPSARHAWHPLLASFDPLFEIDSLTLGLVGMGILVLVSVWLSAGFWVASDAEARGSPHPWVWSGFAMISGVVLIYYLCRWRPNHERTYPWDRTERNAVIVSLAGLLTLLATPLVTPPDPISGLSSLAVLFACCLPVSYLLVERQSHSTP